MLISNENLSSKSFNFNFLFWLEVEASVKQQQLPFEVCSDEQIHLRVVHIIHESPNKTTTD
jgi:hypothetical protein